MRILILHSRYLSGPISGENRVVHEEADLLRQGGHDVELLAPSPDAFSRAALAARALVSAGSARAVRDRVRERGIEIVHAHNLYPALGAGVLRAAAAAGAAVVLTLHNYRLLCVAGTLYRDGRVCHDCLGRPRWPGVVHACYRGSLTESGLLSAAIAGARARGTFAAVDRFLAVSEFVREKHVEAGYEASRILVKPNVVPARARRRGPGSYFLVLGRLTQEKGIAELVRAWSDDLGELRVAGDGPERAEIEQLARGRLVRFLGPLAPDAVAPVLAGARALLVPSAWYEGQPRVMLEAFAAGVPVVASRIGALPELVVEGETGLTVERGDGQGWRDAVGRLRDDEVSTRFGDAAHALWEARFSPARGLAALEDAYAEARAARAGRHA